MKKILFIKELLRFIIVAIPLYLASRLAIEIVCMKIRTTLLITAFVLTGCATSHVNYKNIGNLDSAIYYYKHNDYCKAQDYVEKFTLENNLKDKATIKRGNYRITLIERK